MGDNGSRNFPLGEAGGLSLIARNFPLGEAGGLSLIAVPSTIT